MKTVQFILAALLAVSTAGCSLFTEPGSDREKEKAFVGRWQGGDSRLTLRFTLAKATCQDMPYDLPRLCDYPLEGTYEYVPPGRALVTGRVSGTVGADIDGMGMIDFDGPFQAWTWVYTQKLAANRQSFSLKWSFDEYHPTGVEVQCPTCKADGYFPSAVITFVREP